MYSLKFILIVIIIDKMRVNLSYPEVSRVHSELEGMQFTQFGQGTSEVINICHSLSNSTHDGGSMLLHLGRARAQIGPVRKVGLGLRVSDQHPGKHRNEEVITHKQVGLLLFVFIIIKIIIDG